MLLSSENGGIFRDLTFPSYRPLIDNLSSSGNVIALGLSVNGEPIGLGLARVLPEAKSEILSVFVTKQYRSQGLGAELLSQLEQVLRDRRCTGSQTVYMTGTPSAPIVEHLLLKAGWTPPQRSLVIFRFDRRILTAPWLRRARIRPPYEVIPWTEVQEQELERVRIRQQSQASIPDYLLPFEQDNSFHSEISVGLRFNGELIGWMIGHLIAPNTVRYTKLFVDGKFEGGLLAMAFIGEAIRRQVRELGPNSYVICGVKSENRRAIGLLQRLRPESVRESRIASKVLRFE